MSSQFVLFRPEVLLRIEALLVLFTTCAAYGRLFPHHWILFACLFLVPDLSLVFSLRGAGPLASIAYNSVHSYVFPVLLGVIAFYWGSMFLEEVSLIWIAHIGMVRMLGFGLKYPTSFGFTHIQSAGFAGPSDGVGTSVP